MVTPRKVVSTVTFIDNYCSIYRDLFADVRSYETFKFLHLGMISELPRKSLPAMPEQLTYQTTRFYITV